jgi:arylsulfatase
MVECMDYHLGRVLAFLRDIGEYDDTVIVFLSDNGPNPWVSEEYPGNRTSGALDQFDNRVENIGDKTSHSAYGIGWATACAGPLSYHKLTVGEGGIRSPLIIAGRGIKGAGRIDHQFVYVTDIMPTILGFAGATHPTERRGKKMQPLAGKSMSGVLAETAERVHAPGTLFSGEMLGGRWISDGVYKAVLVVEPYGSGEWELFKIDTDLGETRDLAKERPDLLAKLRAEWGTYAKKVGVVLPPKK